MNLYVKMVQLAPTKRRHAIILEAFISFVLFVACLAVPASRVLQSILTSRLVWLQRRPFDFFSIPPAVDQVDDKANAIMRCHKYVARMWLGVAFGIALLLDNVPPSHEVWLHHECDVILLGAVVATAQVPKSVVFWLLPK